MQVGIVAGHSGAAGSIESAGAGGIACGGLRVASPRRRGVSARKPSWVKYEGQHRSKRPVSPKAVELAENRIECFHKLNAARHRAIFHAVQLLSRYHRTEGARLPQHAFSSEKTGRFIQQALLESELAYCLDWNSWKPTECDFDNAEARAFVPCWELVWADTGDEVVSSFSDYLRKRYSPRAPLHQESCLLYPCTESGVALPHAVDLALRKGTGLYCDFDALRTLLLTVQEAKRNRMLCAAFASVGRKQVDEVCPIWKQHEWGRLYCSKPAFVNMPKVFLPALRSVGGLPLWNTDFSSYELRIAASITGQKLPDRDAYDLIGDSCGISRSRVKAVVNPMLHGQTPEQIWYAKESIPFIKKDRPLVEKQMARLLPKLFNGLDQLRSDDSVLQRKGASVFFHCMGTAIERCGITAAGLPKHDGWVFPGTESQAKAVQCVFESEAQRLTKAHFPVKLEAVI